MRCRVVCALGVTMDSCCPRTAFSSVLLPALGRPMMATKPAALRQGTGQRRQRRRVGASGRERARRWGCALRLAGNHGTPAIRAILQCFPQMQCNVLFTGHACLVAGRIWSEIGVLLEYFRRPTGLLCRSLCLCRHRPCCSCRRSLPERFRCSGIQLGSLFLCSAALGLLGGAAQPSPPACGCVGGPGFGIGRC